MPSNLISEIAIPEIVETRTGDMEFNDPVPDDILVLAAKNGDEDAFEALVKRHERKLLALAFRYTRIHEDAEDVVQQTLQKAFLHLRDFEGKSTFCTWLTRIAINEALMSIRRARALREVPIENSSGEEGIWEQSDIVDASADPETTYLQKEETQTLSMAIKRLAPKVRRALELKELGELSARETARHMGLSLSAVKARVFNGRRELRKHIAFVQNVRSARVASR